MEQDAVQEMLKKRADDEKKKKQEIEERRSHIKVRLEMMKEERMRR